MNRNTNCPGLISNRSRNSLANPPRGISRELISAAVLELINSLHQTDVAFLDQIQELQTAVGVFLSNRNHQTKVGFGHFALSFSSLSLTGCHLVVNVLQILQRQCYSILNVLQLLLEMLNFGQLTLNVDSIGLIAFRNCLRPSQICFVIKEFLEEELTRHLCAVDNTVINTAFVLTNFFNLRFQHGAQAFNCVSRKAQRKQFFLNCVLSLNEGRRAVTLCLVGMLQILIKLFAVIQFGKNNCLEFVNLTCRHTGSTDVCAFIVFSHLLTGFFIQTVNQAVNDLVNLHRAVSDLFSVFQNGNDGRRAAGNSVNHVLQTVFNSLSDFNFAFTSQKLDRPHFSHVHSDRISRTTEFAVNGSQSGFCFFFSSVVTGCRNRVADKQIVGGRSLFIDLNAQVGQCRNDLVNLIRIDNVFRHVVVNFRVSQISSFLTHAD